jgi:uroporphyrinogen-III synthase
VFFSKNGVIGLDRWQKNEDLTFPFDRSTIWAVGRATAGMVWEKFKLPVVQPLEQNALGLLKAFKTIAKKPVVMFTARKSRPQFSEWLVKHHWDYLQVVVYTTQLKANKNLAEHFRNVPDEYVIFTSPSTVKGFLKSLGLPDLGNVASRLISIGPTTADEIRSLNGFVYEELVEPNLADYLEKWCVTND